MKQTPQTDPKKLDKIRIFLMGINPLFTDMFELTTDIVATVSTDGIGAAVAFVRTTVRSDQLSTWSFTFDIEVDEIMGTTTLVEAASHAREHFTRSDRNPIVWHESPILVEN